jgi:hypothetical protein
MKKNTVVPLQHDLQVSDDAVAVCAVGAASFAQTVALMSPAQRKALGNRLIQLGQQVLEGPPDEKLMQSRKRKS